MRIIHGHDEQEWEGIAEAADYYHEQALERKMRMMTGEIEYRLSPYFSALDCCGKQPLVRSTEMGDKSDHTFRCEVCNRRVTTHGSPLFVAIWNWNEAVQEADDE